MNRNKKKKSPLKISTKITLGFVSAYVLLGVFWGWDVIKADIFNRGKVAGATISMTMRIFGNPEKPVVSFGQGCDSNRAPFVRLRWSSDANATSFDIYRDGLELMLDVSENEYVDQNVASQETHDYYVTAKGPAGSAASDVISASAAECPVVADPSIEVETFEQSSVGSGTPWTENSRPIFSGTTNVPNATIDLEIHSEEIVYGSTTANANGFWQWTCPVDLSRGLHTLYVSAKEGGVESDLTANTRFVFRIGREQVAQEDGDDEDDDDDDDDEEGEEENSADVIFQKARRISGNDYFESEKPIYSQKPVEFEISMAEKEYIKGVSVGQESYRGENLDVTTSFADVLDEGTSIELVYEVISPENDVVLQFSDTVFPKKGGLVSKSIDLPYWLELGKYKLRVSAKIGSVTVSKDRGFVLKDRPLIRLGAGSFITKRDVVGNLGSVTFSWIMLVAAFGFLEEREYYLYKKAKRHVSENLLKKLGFIN